MTREGEAIRLRGHHLVCLHFFSGEGYSPEFVATLRRVLARAASGDPLVVVSGADDVCAACPFREGKTCTYSSGAEGEVHHMDGRALALLDLRVSDAVLWASIEERIPLIFARWRAEFCEECDWRAVCEKDARYERYVHERPLR